MYDRSYLITNVFTPNGDGVNDVYRVFNNDALEHELFIYNRWGSLLFYNKMPEIEWYGRDYAGSYVPTGTYYYVLNSTAKDGTITAKTGYITVIRN